MLSSYSTYPTQWQKKKNTKKTNQPWTLLDRSRVLFCKCCRISSLLIIEIGCRSHSLTHSRTRLRSHSRPSALSHSHTRTPAHSLTLSLSHTLSLSLSLSRPLTSKFRRKIAKSIEKREWNEMNLFQSAKNVDDFLLKFWDLSSAKVWEPCRSRKMVQNEYLVAIVAVDPAENEPSKVAPKWGQGLHGPFLR